MKPYLIQIAAKHKFYKRKETNAQKKKGLEKNIELVIQYESEK